MVVPGENNDWETLNTIVYKWVKSHPNLSVDVDLANWMGSSGSILNQYQVQFYHEK